MPQTNNGKKRILRAGTILLLGWLALEIALAQLIAARIGWGMLILAMAVKGGAALALIGLLMMRGLRAIAEAAGRGGGILVMADAGFPVVSAVLLAIPGLVPTLLAIILFAPTLRRFLIRKFTLQARDAPPRDIDLTEDEWRDLGGAKPDTRVEPQRNASEPPPLETNRPSV